MFDDENPPAFARVIASILFVCFYLLAICLLDAVVGTLYFIFVSSSLPSLRQLLGDAFAVGAWVAIATLIVRAAIGDIREIWEK